MALDWQTIQIPLIAGVKGRWDQRALEPPGLLTGQNLRFGKFGGLQKSYPHTALSSNVAGTNANAGVFVGAATAQDGSAVDVSSFSVVSGDTLLFLGVWDTQNEGSAPAGWTSVFDQAVGGGEDPTGHIRCSRFTATGSVTSVSYTMGSAVNARCMVLIYRGVTWSSGSFQSGVTSQAATLTDGGFAVHLIGAIHDSSIGTANATTSDPSETMTVRSNDDHTSTGTLFTFGADLLAQHDHTFPAAEWDVSASVRYIGTIVLDPSSSAALDTFTDPRRLAVYDDELLLFTKEKLLSWSEERSAWVERDTYLAPKVTEDSVFIRNAEQGNGDCAKLGSLTVYAWEEITSDTRIKVAAIDNDTGAIRFNPTAIGSNSAEYRRPRLVALTNKILLFWVDPDQDELLFVSIDPDNLEGSVVVAPTKPSNSAASPHRYDVKKYDGTTVAVAFWSTTDDYTTLFVDEDGTITDEQTRSVSGTPKPTSPIAVACSPDGAEIQVWREADAGALLRVYCDRYDSNFGVVAANISVDFYTDNSGNELEHITAAFRETAETAGEYRCYGFWVKDRQKYTDVTATQIDYSWVDTNGTQGTTSGSPNTLVHQLTIGAHAFGHGNAVYLWTCFTRDSASASGNVISAVQTQSSYFLLRDDGRLMAKAVTYEAGGYTLTSGHLPTTQDRTGGAFGTMLVERRRVIFGTGRARGYSDRGLREAVVTFDSNEARRTRQLGGTLFVTGGQILQFDGETLTELGFHVYPYWISSGGTATGSLDAGDYTYASTFRSDNAKGERDRSTTASFMTQTIGASKEHRVEVSYLPVTLKQPAFTKQHATVEVWRTAKDPNFDAPKYLVTDPDPSDSAVSTTDNAYIPNDPTSHVELSWDDDMPDATATKKEAFPETGGVLESIAPPPATIIAADEHRLFLAGIANNPHLVWYSKRRRSGEVPGFHDALTIPLPGEGGVITALALLNEQLVVFKERAIYLVPGSGIANNGTGTNYGPARLIASDVGAQSADCVGTTSQGIVFFSDKGWHRLTRGGTVEYIGADVVDFDGETYNAVVVMEREHEIRALSSAAQLGFDTLTSNWSERPAFPGGSGTNAVLWRGRYVYIGEDDVVYREDTVPGGGHSMVVETAEIKLAGLQGYKRVREIALLGEYRSSHRIKIELWFDGNQGVADQTELFTPGVAVGAPLDVIISPQQQKMRSVRLRITDEATGGGVPAGEAMRLTGLAFEVGLKKGIFPGGNNT